MINSPVAATSNYEETHCAVSGRLARWCLIYPAAVEIVFLLLTVAVNVNWVIALSLLVVPSMIGFGFAYRNWPTGIRLDESGITIGAIRSRRALSRRPTVYHQSWGLYTCPWEWVDSVRVVTDPDEIRSLTHGHTNRTLNNQWGGLRCDIGVMSSPFMHAALVAEVWPGKVTGTTVRPSRAYSNFKDGYFSHKIVPRMGGTWIVPTQHPDQLEEAVKRYR
jgi:hypothetical protein